MSKFYVGQKVFVKHSTYYTSNTQGIEGASKIVGSIGTVRDLSFDTACVYNSDKTDWWLFNPSDLLPINETPETLTVNGVEYIRKPEPTVEHEWKFGDVAMHEKYGVGIVTRILGDGGLEFDYKAGEYSFFADPSTLTFIRRADLSV